MSRESARRQAKSDPSLRHRYETLRSVLRKNGTALQLISDLEADLNHLEYTDPALLRPLRRLLDESLLMAQELNLLAGDRYRPLYGVIGDIRQKIVAVFNKRRELAERALIIDVDSDKCLDSRIVGGKAAGLAELRRRFSEHVPDGFVVTIDAYRLFMEENDLIDKVRMLINDLESVTDRHQFKSRTGAIRELIQSASVPAAIAEAIRDSAAGLCGDESKLWAVRSSALSEDQRFSFAGQFDSLLNVATEDLAQAYRSVLASRFSDRAILYRLHCGIREVETPMAVLFVPMIEPRAAGVIYTRDPQDPASGNMMVCAVPGLADRMVRGEERGEIVHLSRRQDPVRVGDDASRDFSGAQYAQPESYLPEAKLKELGGIAFSASQDLGYDMDVEWILDKDGELWLLQGRRLQISTTDEILERKRRPDPPIVEGGYTLVPGRAVGPVIHVKSNDASPLIGKAAIAVVDQGTPELAEILPHIAALLIRHGSPVGHLSALVREFSVPCLDQLGDSVKLLNPGSVVSVDTTKRRIYTGSRWPGLRERVLTRISTAKQKLPSGLLYDLVLELNLTDPFAPSFKAKKCSSVHDVIRFIHEMSVRTMFGFGDSQSRPWKKNVRHIKAPLPVKLKLIDLDGSVPEGKGPISPEEVASTPFKALWRGISDPRVTWAPVRVSAIESMPPDFLEKVLGGAKGPRRQGDANYAVVAEDYLNLNARFAYHYAMVDTITGPGKEVNHVHFRYRGGGASDEQRIRRARFLEEVLRSFHFGVDRRGDLITAWLRNHSRADSEKALEMLGRLMACSRQLDMFLTDDAMIKRLVEKYLNEEYSAFA